MKITRTPGKGAKALENALGKIKKANGSVGWYPSARYEGYQPKTDRGVAREGVPVATVAAMNEFGPYARPFMRPTIANQKQNWQKQLKSGAKAILAGNNTGDEVLESVLMLAAADIRKTITEIQSPPLKDATVKARLRKMADGKTIGNLTKPLVETKIMLNTLTYSMDE